MGLLDRLKALVQVDLPDPNPPLTGISARGRITAVGRYAIGGEGSMEVRWSKKEVTLHVVGEPSDHVTTVSCFLGQRAFVRMSTDVEVPVIVDAHGVVLGIDVAAWEAEVTELDRAGTPIRQPTPPVDRDARTWELEAAALESVEGVDFDGWVRVEAALATEAVPPSQHDARAAQLGVPVGRWALVQSEWQRRMRADWKLAARFGAAYAAATGQS